MSDKQIDDDASESDSDLMTENDWIDPRDAHPCPYCGGDGMLDDVCECLECDGTGIDIAYW